MIYCYGFEREKRVDINAYFTVKIDKSEANA